MKTLSLYIPSFVGFWTFASVSITTVTSESFSTLTGRKSVIFLWAISIWGLTCKGVPFTVIALAGIVEGKTVSEGNIIVIESVLIFKAPAPPTVNLIVYVA